MIKELLKELKEYRNELVSKNYPFQRISNLILKYEDRIKEKKSSIALNLGYYPYKEYEPFAFWGKRNIPGKHPSNGLDQNTY